MGNTLYIGSLKSEVYFCVYEKDYEQYVKYDIPVEETLIKNRFEIRLKNERAYYAVRDLLTYHDAERTAFSIINRYVRFADKDETKRRSDWQTNERWAWFIGEDRRRLKLTTKPEPYDFQRTLNWLSRQVAPTLQVAEKPDKKNNATIIKDMIKNAKLTDRLEKILKQLSVTVEEMTVYDKEDWYMLHFSLWPAAGIGIVIMCILQVGKEADTHLEEFERRNDKWILDRIYITGF